MNTWLIEPRDPLIARDGRPFNATPGARASSLPFPYPSTTTGAVRTRAGSNAEGIFNEAQTDYVKGLAVRGPLLVELNATTGEIADWLLPAPADALLLEDEAGPAESAAARRRRLIPLQLPAGAQTDLGASYHIVGMINPVPAKPYSKTPRFWRWAEFERWLVEPTAEDNQEGEIVSINGWGHSGPLAETRTHVKIDPNSQTADKSFLFQTRGLEFTRSPGAQPSLRDEPQRLGLALATTAELARGVDTLGGERRMVVWRPSERPWLPDCPATLHARIAADKACRVLMLTPALFKHGWRPNDDLTDEDSKLGLLAERYGVRPTLTAAVLPRHQVISGWDYEHRGPKQTRRLTPAGAVYFLRLAGEPAAIEEWVTAMWRSCVSDAEQDQLDGFGLAALGVWSGTPQLMRGEQ